MTTAPLPDDLDEIGVEQRVCATCYHEESDHELIETGVVPRVVCRLCDDPHPFLPFPD